MINNLKTKFYQKLFEINSMNQLMNLKNKLFSSFLAKFKKNTLEVLLLITLTSFGGIVLLIGNITAAVIFMFIALIVSYVCDYKVNSKMDDIKDKHKFLTQIMDVNYISKNKDYGIIIFIFALCAYCFLLVLGALTSILVR